MGLKLIITPFVLAMGMMYSSQAMGAYIKNIKKWNLHKKARVYDYSKVGRVVFKDDMCQTRAHNNEVYGDEAFTEVLSENDCLALNPSSRTLSRRRAKSDKYEFASDLVLMMQTQAKRSEKLCLSRKKNWWRIFVLNRRVERL